MVDYGHLLVCGIFAVMTALGQGDADNAASRRLECAAPRAGTVKHTPPTRRRDTLIALFLAILWVWACGMAGVASDFTTIPLPKKLAIMVSSSAIFALLARVRSWGCFIAFAVLAAWIVGVMWFWN
jgi:hypothetical protein